MTCAGIKPPNVSNTHCGSGSNSGCGDGLLLLLVGRVCMYTVFCILYTVGWMADLGAVGWYVVC